MHILEFKKDPFSHFQLFSDNVKFNPIQNRIPSLFIRFCMSLCKWNRRNDWILNLFICCWFAFLCSSSETQFKYYFLYDAFPDTPLGLIIPYLWYFYSIHLYVCLYVTPNCFDYHTFVICFETWTCEILQVCSSSPRQCMAIQVPLRVHINVGIDFCISTKSAVGILVWMILNLQITLGRQYGYFKNIKSFYSWTWNLSI